MHRTRTFIAALFFTPLAALAQTATTPLPEEFQFRFQPPDGTRVRIEYRLLRTRTVEGQPSIKDEAETQTQGVFKNLGEAFEYSPKTLSSSLRRNGTPLNDPVMGLLSKLDIAYVISKGGEAVQIRGFGEAEKLLKSTMPAQMAAALAPMFTEASLASREKAEWNARYFDFADGSFKIGDTVDVQAPQQLPNGETITYTIRTSFPNWVPCPSGNCVRVVQVYESDAAELAKLVGGVLSRIADAASAPEIFPQFSKGAPRITGSLVRVIDPKSMLIYSEQVKRTISMQLQIPGQSAVPMVLDESRSYVYSYN